MHDGLHSFQDSTIRYNISKERKTCLRTHCQDTLKTLLDSHRLSENQISTNNSSNNKKQQHPNTQQPPLYPQNLLSSRYHNTWLCKDRFCSGQHQAQPRGSTGRNCSYHHQGVHWYPTMDSERERRLSK